MILVYSYTKMGVADIAHEERPKQVMGENEEGGVVSPAGTRMTSDHSPCFVVPSRLDLLEPAERSGQR